MSRSGSPRRTVLGMVESDAPGLDEPPGADQRGHLTSSRFSRAHYLLIMWSRQSPPIAHKTEEDWLARGMCEERERLELISKFFLGSYQHLSVAHFISL